MRDTNSSKPKQLSRRQASKMLAAAVCVASCGCALGVATQEQAWRLALLRLLRERFDGRHPLRVAAGAYLRQYPGESGLERLCGLIQDGAGSNGAGNLQACLTRCAANEFAAGDVVVVEGWVLARSEGRLLAAASLVTSDV